MIKCTHCVNWSIKLQIGNSTCVTCKYQYQQLKDNFKLSAVGIKKLQEMENNNKAFMADLADSEGSF